MKAGINSILFTVDCTFNSILVTVDSVFNSIRVTVEARTNSILFGGEAMTHNLCKDAVRDMQHAAGALRRLYVLASMGAVPSREDYALVHQQAVELNQVFNRLLKVLRAQGMFESVGE